VSADGEIVGDEKWLKNCTTPAAKWQAIAEYVWLLQKVPAGRRFLMFGRDAAVAKRYLDRVRPLLAPAEVYFLDEDGLRPL
jgi:hypothetical protein